ncbi:MAG: exo-alpha-sialidase [Actinobacteria bacterium]|nr:exo-alpha-sialidase [Actinomycetota bacterium]
MRCAIQPGGTARRAAAAIALGAAAIALGAAGPAHAAAPAGATLRPDKRRQGSVQWHGQVSIGTDLGGSADGCFDQGGRPDPGSGCDFYRLDVRAPSHLYRDYLGGVRIGIGSFGQYDLDLAIYGRNPDGTRGEPAGSSANGAGTPESVNVEAASGAYWVVVVNFLAPAGQTYEGSAAFYGHPAHPTLKQLNRRIGNGPVNYRASHDRYTSHSEPSIAMDPLNHRHLIAASKMYENNAEYLFKVGTYESFDGGRRWRDLGQLPGYCTQPGYCDPHDQTRYRTVSDPSVAFDDEGDAYVNTLDAPGGTFAFTGFNQTVAIKRPGKPWSNPITVHDNRGNPLTAQTMLDDKNWMAVDNHTDVSGGPNRPRDGRVGWMYVCWSLDGTSSPNQQIVLMRSKDGGHTWGGATPGDNTPIVLSQKGVIAGIGCHEAIGPNGELYVTWYDSELDALMQVKSTDHGTTFSAAKPIATITGVDNPFPGQAYRNLSIPTTGVDRKGTVYVAVDSAKGDGAPVAAGYSIDDLKRQAQEHRADTEAAGDAKVNSDVILFKSTDGGASYTGPVRVNRDRTHNDQFQPWLAVTPKGQLDIFYFDKRRDPQNFFVGETLSRSNDGGRTFKDVRFDHQMWDPRVNPPISVSGQFIGDYQGIVADDRFAMPFWNDTQLSNLPPRSRRYSRWQEVLAARIPNDPRHGGPRRHPKHERAEGRRQP